nr:hypothetical protein [Tanacetum cinerariifolium]
MLTKNIVSYDYSFDLREFVRPAPTVESSPDDAQNRNPSVTATKASPYTISPKPFIKFVKAADCTEAKTNKVEAARKSYKVKRLERELKVRTPIQKVDRGRSRCSIKLRGGLLGIKCSKIFPLSVMSFHCQKKFSLLEEVPPASEESSPC